MPQKRKQRPDQIGDYWLSKRRGSPNYCATRFNAKTGQTSRRSFGTDDFDEAKIRLAEFVVRSREMRDERPEDMQVAVVLALYWDNHAINLPSAETAALASRYLMEFFKDETVAGLTLDRQEAFAEWCRSLGHSDGYISRHFSTLRAALTRAYKRG